MNLSLLERLTTVCGTSGNEQAVREFIISKLPADCEKTVDNMGNLIVTKKGKETPKNKVMKKFYRRLWQMQQQ